jgi:hypothetical protein
MGRGCRSAEAGNGQHCDEDQFAHWRLLCVSFPWRIVSLADRFLGGSFPWRIVSLCKHREARAENSATGPFQLAQDLPRVISTILFYWLMLVAFPPVCELFLEREDFG